MIEDQVEGLLYQNAPELTEGAVNPLFSEWLLIAVYTDALGVTSIVCQTSRNQLRSHTLGLLEMAREEV